MSFFCPCNWPTSSAHFLGFVKVMFYGFYPGKSPWNHHSGEYFFQFVWGFWDLSLAYKDVFFWILRLYKIVFWVDIPNNWTDFSSHQEWKHWVGWIDYSPSIPINEIYLTSSGMGFTSRPQKCYPQFFYNDWSGPGWRIWIVVLADDFSAMNSGSCFEPYIWSNYSDLTRVPHPKRWFSKGNPRLFQGNLFWWNILISPDTFQMSKVATTQWDVGFRVDLLLKKRNAHVG